MTLELAMNHKRIYSGFTLIEIQILPHHAAMVQRSGVFATHWLLFPSANLQRGMSGLVRVRFLVYCTQRVNRYNQIKIEFIETRAILLIKCVCRDRRL